MLASLLTLASFSSFGLAMERYFERSSGVRLPMKLVELVGPPLALVEFIAVKTTNPDGSAKQAAATLLLAAALALFLWTWGTARRQVRLPIAFSTTAPATLIVAGPYAYCRHPFYMSYICVWA